MVKRVFEGAVILNKRDGTLSRPDRRQFTVFTDDDWVGHFSAAKTTKVVRVTLVYDDGLEEPKRARRK